MSTLDDALKQPDLPPGPHYLQNSQVRQHSEQRCIRYLDLIGHIVLLIADNLRCSAQVRELRQGLAPPGVCAERWGIPVL